MRVIRLRGGATLLIVGRRRIRRAPPAPGGRPADAHRHAPLRLEYESPSNLKRREASPRHHPQAQIRKLRHSLRAFGCVVPLVVDDQLNVVCGSARVEAAIAEQIAQVPIVRVSHLTEAQLRAFALADNRLTEEAVWAKPALKREFAELIVLGIDLDLTGFDQVEIDMTLSIDLDPAAAEDRVAEPAGPVIAHVGDLWQIGDHRLVVGDARDPLVYEQLLDGERAQFVFADPPYGCRITNNVSGHGAVKHDDFVMGATGRLDAEFSHGLLRPALKCLRLHSLPGCIAMICMDWRGLPFLFDAAEGVFDELKNLIVWSKFPGMGSFYRNAHELVLAYKITPGEHINTFQLGKRHRTNVWSYAGATSFDATRLQELADHPTVKPKKLVADAILDCSKRNGIVLDNFAGSGTTLVAAAMTGRRGRGIELDPKYADVILRRVADETGCTPLLGGEIPLAEVGAKRLGTAELEVARG